MYNDSFLARTSQITWVKDVNNNMNEIKYKDIKNFINENEIMYQKTFSQVYFKWYLYIYTRMTCGQVLHHWLPVLLFDVL